MADDVFPIEILKVSMNHFNGSKSYHLIRALRADGKSIQVNRFGKTGREGQIQVLCHDHSGAEAFNEKFKAKEKGGYEQVDRKKLVANNLSELKNMIGLQLFYKLGKEAIEHLVPGADTTGVTDETVEETTTLDKDGNPVPVNINTRPPRVIKEEVPKEPTIEERVAADPLWGTF